MDLLRLSAIDGKICRTNTDAYRKGPQTVKHFNRLESAALLTLLFATALNVQDAQAASPSDLYARAKRAIASGNVVPERDLAPLIAVLRGPSSEEDLRSAIDKIETLADASGSSPAEVKHYLLEQSTPLLLNIAATGPSVFARGDAVTALRDMGASRAVLDQAATIAEHDRDDYVRSRAEILRNFMKSMPAATSTAAAVYPTARSTSPCFPAAAASRARARARSRPSTY